MATPDLNRPEVQGFCAEHFPGARARYVAVQVMRGATPGECFDNVQSVVAKRGGRMTLGWHLWEIPDLLLEAEYHAVWEKPSGTLVDVTPQLAGYEEAKILFVPMRKDRFRLPPPDNIRAPLSDDPEVLVMCQLKQAIVALAGKGTRTGNKGEVQLAAPYANDLLKLQRGQVAVMRILAERYPGKFQPVVQRLPGEPHAP